jgi:hypothetical protein
MPTSEATLCNLALARIGDTDNFLEDLGTDTSEEAALCNVFYENQRDSLLAAFWWPFATRRAVLPASAEDPRAGWGYIYTVPTDCVAARYIYPSGPSQVLYTPLPPSQLMGVWTNPRMPRPDQRVPFSVESGMTTDPDGNLVDSKVLLCDLTTPLLVYTSRMTDPANFPPLFKDALAWSVAAEIAMPLTKKTNLQQFAQGKFEAAWRLAAAMGMNEAQEDAVPDSEMVSGRL